MNEKWATAENWGKCDFMYVDFPDSDPPDGAVYVVGDIVGVIAREPMSEDWAMHYVYFAGLFKFPCADVHIEFGDRVYWDEKNLVATNEDTGIYIGHAMSESDECDQQIDVRLGR